MSALVANISAICLYLLAGALLARSLQQLKPVNRPALLGVTSLAVIFHALGSYQLISAPGGINLSLFPVLSLIFCTINAIVLASAIKKPVQNLFILLFPLTILAMIASQLAHSSTSAVALTPGLSSHILLSIVAYSLLSIATLQALLLAFQNHQIRHKRPLRLLQLLPPLQTMENLLFEMLWAGQILLTLSIVSGITFLDDLFAQHVAHKTVFTLIAWCIYAVLLWGRHWLGWRGYTAIRWTLAGFAMLMLAYFGSKLVLEFILAT
ncbi:MAG TPA: cytochrome c biogenesis protein CcsA [Cellvibrionaceae bacterium]